MKHAIALTSRLFPVALVLALASAAVPSLLKAEGPAAPVPPKVSTFAPAEDLVGQVDAYVRAVNEGLASADDYNDAKEQIARDANTLAVVALALGLHDQQNQYQAGAAAVIKAAQDLAATADYEAAKKAAEKLQTAVGGKGKAAGELKWTKVAALDQLMKQVPLVNTRLKRAVSRKKTKEAAGYSAVLAAIAQGSMANTEAAKTPGQVAQWQKSSAQMRDAAGKLNAGIHAGNEQAAAAAMKKLAQSCEDCHAVFKK